MQLLSSRWEAKKASTHRQKTQDVGKGYEERGLKNPSLFAQAGHAAFIECMAGPQRASGQRQDTGSDEAIHLDRQIVLLISDVNCCAGMVMQLLSKMWKAEKASKQKHKMKASRKEKDSGEGTDLHDYEIDELANSLLMDLSLKEEQMETIGDISAAKSRKGRR